MKKRVVFSAVLAAVMSILAAQIYSNLNIAAVWTNKIGRIDIFAENGKIEVLKEQSDISTSKEPDWCKKDGKICVTNDFDLQGRAHKYNLTFVVHGSGQASVRFMGPDVKIDGNRKPIPIDYKNISVNGEKILKHRKTVWHDKPFERKFDVKDKDVIKISFEARRHRYRLGDLSKIYGGSWLIFLSIYIIVFAILFKLLGAKNKFTANHVFVILLFALMSVPMLSISDAKKSLTENRMLATKPNLLNDKGVNLKYGEEYDAWFNDRFAGRELLLNLHTGIEKHINRYLRNRRAIMDTKTNWCFNNYNVFAQSNGQQALQGLNALDKFAQDIGARLYVMIVPDKNDVYKQYHPFIQEIPDIYDKEAVSYITEHASFPIVFPIEELRKAAESDYVFFKTEHHWTEWGAYNGYLALMRQIKKNFSYIPVVSEKDYDIFYNRRVRGYWRRDFGLGQTFDALHVKMPENDFLDTDYRYYTPHNDLRCDINNISRYRTKHYSNNSRGRYRAILTGTSMNENLLQFLPYSFRELKYFRLNNVDDVKNADQFKIIQRYANDFKQYKPDIIILVVTSQNIYQLKYIESK